MSVKLRLTRRGRKSLPCYKIVAANSSAPRDGKFIEELGSYHPLSHKNLILTDDNKKRIEYWISVGAKPTDRVSRLLISNGVEIAKKYMVKFVPRKKGEFSKKSKKKS